MAENLHGQVKGKVLQLAKLDRFLFSTQWNDKFPISIQRGLASQLSDHFPLSLDTSELTVPKRFRFEEVWLNAYGFKGFCKFCLE